MVATTFITPSGSSVVDAAWDGDSPRLGVEQLADATGWTLNADGFCRGDLCVPDRAGLSLGGEVDLAAVAEALDSPVVFDVEIPAVVLGEQRSQRALALRHAQLPPFELPDLQGTPMPSSTWANKKKVLVVFASW